jgi:hypothetical protein
MECVHRIHEHISLVLLHDRVYEQERAFSVMDQFHKPLHELLLREGGRIVRHHILNRG